MKERPLLLTNPILPRAARKVDRSIWNVPVIFANGRDDDGPGLVAAAANERVLFDAKIYEPDENIDIVGRNLALSAPGVTVVDCDGDVIHMPPGMPPTPGYLIVRYSRMARQIAISRCHIKLNVQVQA